MSSMTFNYIPTTQTTAPHESIPVQIAQTNQEGTVIQDQVVTGSTMTDTISTNHSYHPLVTHSHHPLEPVPENLIETETVHDNVIQNNIDENANEMLDLGVDAEVIVTTEEENEATMPEAPIPEPLNSFAVGNERNKQARLKRNSEYQGYEEKQINTENESEATVPQAPTPLPSTSVAVGNKRNKRPRQKRTSEYQGFEETDINTEDESAASMSDAPTPEPSTSFAVSKKTNKRPRQKRTSEYQGLHEKEINTEDESAALMSDASTPEPSTSFAVSKKTNKRPRQKRTSDQGLHEKEINTEDEYVEVDDNEPLAHLRKANVYSCKICIFKTLDEETIKLHKFSHDSDEVDSSDSHDNGEDKDYVPPIPKKRKKHTTEAEVSKKSEEVVREIETANDELVSKKIGRIVTRLVTKASVKAFENNETQAKQRVNQGKPLKMSARIRQRKMKNAEQNAHLREMVEHCKQLEICKNRREKSSEHRDCSSCVFLDSLIKTTNRHLKHRCDTRNRRACRLFRRFSNDVCEKKLYKVYNFLSQTRLYKLIETFLSLELIAK